MRVEDHFAMICAVREAVMLYDIDCVWVGGWECCAFVHCSFYFFFYFYCPHLLRINVFIKVSHK